MSTQTIQVLGLGQSKCIIFLFYEPLYLTYGYPLKFVGEEKSSKYISPKVHKHYVLLLPLIQAFLSKKSERIWKGS
jgi:hypothetical protein